MQLSVQLEPLQPESPMSHASCAGHVHELPVHSGGGGASLPQATRTTNQEDSRRVCRKRTIDMLHIDSKNDSAHKSAQLLDAESTLHDRRVTRAKRWYSGRVAPIGISSYICFKAR